MNFQIEYNVFSKAIFLVFLLFVVYGSQAEQIEHPYFWKAEKDGKTSYFLGTIHEPILKRQMVPVSASLSFILLNSPRHKPFYMDSLLCSEEIQNHLEDSDLVFVEIDSFSARSREAIATQAQWMLSEDGKEFQALSEGSQEFLLDRGISPQLNLYGYTVVLDNLCNSGFKSVDGLRLDEQITRVAHSKGIPVQELDDFDERYEHFMRKRKQTADEYKQLSDKQFWIKIFLLNEQIQYFSTQCPPQWYVDKVESYISGKSTKDIEKLLDDLSFAERWKTLFEWKERNIKWLSCFKEAHKDYDRIFLVGGLAHFVEPISLIDMLKERDYTVESVTCEN